MAGVQRKRSGIEHRRVRILVVQNKMIQYLLETAHKPHSQSAMKQYLRLFNEQWCLVHTGVRGPHVVVYEEPISSTVHSYCGPPFSQIELAKFASVYHMGEEFYISLSVQLLESLSPVGAQSSTAITTVLAASWRLLRVFIFTSSINIRLDCTCVSDVQTGW